MKPSRASVPVLLLVCHVCNTITEYTLCKTGLCTSFHNFSLRLESWLVSDFLVWAPWFRSWRKELVYLMSALGPSQMQTVLVHSSADKQARKANGRGWGKKEVTDKKTNKHGMLMAHLTCDFFFSVYLFWWCICSLFLNLYFDELIWKA